MKILPITTSLKHSEILKALQTSALSEEEKVRFSNLLETMTEEESLELEQLIKESNQSKKAFEDEKKERLGQLNLATIEKLKKTEKEDLKYIRVEAEKYDGERNEKELEQVQNKIIEDEKINLSTQKIENNNLENSSKPIHEGRNFILILLVLLLIGGTLIYGLLIL